MIKKSMLFLHTFFDVISLVENSLDMLAPLVFEVSISMDEKSMSYFFRCKISRRKIHVVSTYFLEAISMIEISTFSRTFFDVISLVEKSTFFPLIFFDVILMVEKFTLFARGFFEEFLMGKNWTTFLVSCRPMKASEEVFLC